MLWLREKTAPYLQPSHEANMTKLAVLSPYFGMYDFQWFYKQIGDITTYLKLNSQLFDELKLDVREFGLEYNVPVLYITGSEDYTCNGVLVEEYINEISAPYKEMLYIEGCGHGVHYDNPKEFAAIVNNFITQAKCW